MSETTANPATPAAGTAGSTRESDPRPAKGAGKDYGNWKYGDWKGVAMWTDSETGNTSFDEKYVKRIAKTK